MEHFPREISQGEKKLLFSILPGEKPGYKKYRENIEKLFVIGEGRFGGTNLVLGKKDMKPDIISPSAPVFAFGSAVTNIDDYDIVIHEDIDDEIEFDIAPKPGSSEEIVIQKSWSYSEWAPGQNAPNDDSGVREIVIIPDNLILVIAPVHKKIWLHETSSGINYIIPVTNFYNYLMMVKNFRSMKIVSNQSLMFKNLDSYSDMELISTFLAYNKYFKRVNVDYSFFETTRASKKKKNFLRIFTKG